MRREVQNKKKKKKKKNLLIVERFEEKTMSSSRFWASFSILIFHNKFFV